MSVTGQPGKWFVMECILAHSSAENYSLLTNSRTRHSYQMGGYQQKWLILVMAGCITGRLPSMPLNP
jgi:hypothetical protein